MKVKTIKRGRRIIYQLRDNGEILSAACDEYLDYLNSKKSKRIPRHLKILCTYRNKKLQETCV